MEVVAPVPWSFGKALSLGKYRLFAQTPRTEIRNGVTVYHPRFFNVPGMGQYTAPFAIAAGALSTIERLRRDGFDFDVIDAHYFYPDGVAAALLARRFKKPLVITARGSDVNLLPNFLFPRRLIKWAAGQAAAIVTVSAALRDKLLELGVAHDKMRVIPNGVDSELFHPIARNVARAALGLDNGIVLLSVGNLVPEKGHSLAIEALTEIPRATLLIVGEGPDDAKLRSLVNRLGVGERVRFLGAHPQGELSMVYSAADALILASAREGWPNVLLESMACGTPVVANAVGGIPEIVCSRVAGTLIQERVPAAIAAAVREVLAQGSHRDETRNYARARNWDDAAGRQAELFLQIAAV